MTTREERKAALSRAIAQSKNGIMTYVLISGGNICITQDEKEAKTLVKGHNHRVYAKCKDGYMTL